MIQNIRIAIWKYKKWYFLLILVLLFTLLAKMVFYNDTIKIDIWFYNFAVKWMRHDITTTLMKFITNLGNPIVLISICLICFIFIKNKKIPRLITLNLIIITILNTLMKLVIQRDRPIGYRLIKEKGYSFPSGHSMITMG